MNHHAPSLSRDERGMILIIAIPMALIGVGCVFYLASVGDAIFYRERLQDVADATALGSAVLHAQAMNAAVSLNLLLVVLSSLTGLLQTLQWLSLTSVAVLGSSQPQFGVSVEEEREQMSRIVRAADIVASTREALTRAAPVLAITVASAENTLRARQQHAADGAVALSHAALPRRDRQQLAVDPRQPWLLSPKLDSDARVAAEVADEGASLPLARASAPVLCDHVREIANTLADGSLAQHAEAVQARSLLARQQLSLSAALASVFCPAAPAVPRQPPAVEHVPKIMDPAAQNGNALLQTWSIVRASDDPRARRNAQGRRLIALGRPVETPSQGSAVAQAEYYFACTASWPDCAADAAFSPRWAARLRRYERPDGETWNARSAAIARAFVHERRALEAGLRARDVALNVHAYIRELFLGQPCGAAGCIH